MKPIMINIIPAIDLIDGKCVRLTKGDYNQKKEYRASPLDMALRYADQLAVMKDGRLTGAGTPEEMYESGGVGEAFEVVHGGEERLLHRRGVALVFDGFHSRTRVARLGAWREISEGPSWVASWTRGVGQARSR